MVLKDHQKTGSLFHQSVMLTSTDSQMPNSHLKQTQCMKLSEGCATNEMSCVPAVPFQGLQQYLQCRVSKIAAQIGNSCSAHHFERHIVEIDELLRCDAPMGFTPSMVLAGVPDIISTLCKALLSGYLLHPTHAKAATMRALTPVRVSAVPWKNTRPPVSERVETTIAPSSRATSPLGRSRKSVMRSSVNRRSVGSLKSGASSVKLGKSSMVASVAESSDADIRPFLPPIVRRPIGFAQNSTSAANNSTASESRRATAQSEQQDPQGNNLEGSSTQVNLRSSLRRPRSSAAGHSAVNDGAATVHSALSDLRHRPLEPSAQPDVQVLVADAPPHVPLLRDIPSALQALLYHCALPLVCLTTHDQRQRLAAVRALASVMSAMMRVTKESMQGSEALARHGDCKKKAHAAPTLDKDDTSSDDDDGIRVNVDGDSASDTKEDTDTSPGGIGIALDYSDMPFQIRHAALAALHTLLSVIHAEGETIISQHFSARDRRRYDMSACGDMYPHSHLQSMSSATAHDIPPCDGKGACIARTLPLSVPNGAVAVDVLVPLLERWTALLDRRVGDNAVLDSALHAITRRDPLPPPLKSRVSGSVGTKTEGLVYATMKKSRISKKDAAELHLILRICLQLSTYRHHARPLVCPEKSEIGFQHTTASHRVMSLPVLLCLTMARCAEGDHCLSLCVDCLWNLLDVLPEDTVRAILQHEPEDSLKSSTETDAMSKMDESSETEARTRTFTSLSASEAFLHTFMQILLTGHRAEQRELRNDFVVIFSLLFRHDTAVLHREEHDLRRRLFAAHYNQSDDDTTRIFSPEEDKHEHEDDLFKMDTPPRTFDALCTIAMTVFDLVCGTELRASGSKSRVMRSSTSHFARHHTVLSPTTRVENLQFKLLGWRMLEAFHVWEGTQCAVQRIRQRLQAYASEIRQSLFCAPVESLNKDNAKMHNNRRPNSNKKYKETFDMFRDGLMTVLLCYVDMRCENPLVVAWTREELLALQGEAWRVLLALMEASAEWYVSKWHIPKNSFLPMRGSRVRFPGELSSFSSRGEVVEEGGGAVVTEKERKEVNSTRPLAGVAPRKERRHKDRKHTPLGQDGAESDHLNDGNWNDAECAEGGESWKQEEEEDDDDHNASELVSVDQLFIDKGGISCVLRYICLAPADTEEMVFLALRVLSALSHHPHHRRALLTATLTMEEQSPGAENVCCEDINSHSEEEAELFVIVMELMKGCIRNASSASVQQKYIEKVVRCNSANKKKREKMSTKHRKDRDRLGTDSCMVSCTPDSMLVSTYTQRTQLEKNAKVVFTPNGRGVLIHALLLLYNMAEGPENVSVVQEYFMEMGGIELLLSLVRHALPYLTHKRAWSTRELLRVVLSCVRVFVLESAVARRRFVLEDGLHLLLCIIGVFAAQQSKQKHKSLNADDLYNKEEEEEGEEEREKDEEEGEEEEEEVNKKEGGETRTSARGTSNSLLTSTLAILSDLLNESDEAREEFLSWSRPQSDDFVPVRQGHHSSMQDGDDGRINATQLLLSLWNDSPELLLDSREPEPLTTTEQSALPSPDPTAEGASAHVGAGGDTPLAPGSDRTASCHGEGEAVGEDLETKVHCKDTNSERTMSRGTSGNPCAKGEQDPIPVLRADCWGLAGAPGNAGSRVAILRELRRRYAELSLHNDELDAILAGGPPVATDSCTSYMYHPSKTSIPHVSSSYLITGTAMMKRAQRRLAAVLCQVLGIRVKIFACLAAIGFDRLSKVRASALERIKLLYLAALPAMCRDEVWAAMAEAVDFNGRAHVVPVSSCDEKPKDGGNGAHMGHNDDDDDDDKDALIRPIVPDAMRLVDIMSGVDARAAEIRNLVSATTAINAAHEEECTQRFLISHMRRGDDNERVASLVRSARNRHVLKVEQNARTVEGNIEVCRSDAELQWNIIDSAMHHAQHDKGTIDSAPHVQLMKSKCTVGEATVPPRRLTAMERKKKRDLMIRASRQPPAKGVTTERESVATLE